MKQIQSYEDLSPLLSAQLKRGVMTNTALTQEDWRREIAGGTLWAEGWDGGLILLRRREGYARLNFYLQELALPAGLNWEGPTVMEIAARPRDEALAAAVEFWKGQGFKELFRRVRMTLPKGVAIPLGDCPLTPRPAQPQDLERVWALYQANYDPMTSCMPTRDELARDIAAGNVLCAIAPDGTVAGMQRFLRAPGRVQPQHLAFDPAYRRQGGGWLLMACCARQTDYVRNVLWVRMDNPGPRRLYERMGYVPDGWGSTALYRP